MFNEKFNKTLNCILKNFGDEIGEHIEKIKAMLSEEGLQKCAEGKSFEIVNDDSECNLRIIKEDLTPYDEELHRKIWKLLSMLVITVDPEEEKRNDEILAEIKELEEIEKKSKIYGEEKDLILSVSNYDEEYELCLKILTNEDLLDIPFRMKGEPFLNGERVTYFSEKSEVCCLMFDEDCSADDCCTYYTFTLYKSTDGYHLQLGIAIDAEENDHKFMDEIEVIDRVIDIEELVESGRITTNSK